MLPPLTGVRRLGLLGGTFDPIHNGHLVLADHCSRHQGLDRVWFIPSGNPPHKRQTTVESADVRRRLTEAAVAPYEPRFRTVDIELRRDGPSYTADTIQEIHEYAGPGVELFWIVGRDNLSELPHWYQPERIVEYAIVLAGGRPGADDPDDLPAWFRERLVLLDGPDLDISSTDIRTALADGRVPADLLPAEVASAILQGGLYGIRG